MAYLGNFTLSFKNEHIIEENEVRCLVEESDFNLSYNPTIVTGSYIRSSNNLTEAELWTKQERQDYKLQLAQLRRRAAGDTSAKFYRENNTYDLTLLPDTYNNNSPGSDDNPNTGGLVVGRPWLNVAGIVFAANIWRTDYQGYFGDVPSFFDTAALKAAPNTYTGTHTFYLNSDDGSYLWIGLTALSGYTTANALVQNGGLHALSEVSATISLVAGTYYPIRIQFGNGPAGPGALTASYAHSGQAKTSTWTGKIFYNTATNGF